MRAKLPLLLSEDSYGIVRVHKYTLLCVTCAFAYHVNTQQHIQQPMWRRRPMALDSCRSHSMWERFPPNPTRLIPSLLHESQARALKHTKCWAGPHHISLWCYRQPLLFSPLQEGEGEWIWYNKCLCSILLFFFPFCGMAAGKIGLHFWREALRLTSLDVDFCNDMAMRFFLVIAVGS